MDRNTANLTIDNYILGKKARSYRHVFITDDDVPSCDLEKKVINSPVLPCMVNPDLDRVIRGKNAHEAGHGRLTPRNKDPKWSKVKGNLVNVLEDLRIERGVGRLSPAFKEDLAFMNTHVTQELNVKFSTEGYHRGPVNEALLILLMRGNGFYPMWEVSEKASELVDLAIPDFEKWVEADPDTEAGFSMIEEIADAILHKWEESVKDEDDESEKSDKSDKSDKSESGEGESGESGESGEGESDESEGDEGGESDKSEGGESGESEGESDKSEGEGESESGDEENTEGESEGGESDKSEGESSEGLTSESKAKSGKGSKKGHAKESLDDLCDDGDDRDDILREEIGKAKAESASVFNSYTPWTEKDKVICPEVDSVMQDNFNRAHSEINGAIASFSDYMNQSLRTMSRNRKIGGRDRGFLDPRSFVALATNTSRDVFYTVENGISLDTVVSILIDESGSMGCNRKYLSCRRVAIALAEVLDNLNIRFEVLGHTTGRIECPRDMHPMFNRVENLVMYEIKRFSQPYQSEKYRFGSIRAEWNNIDGEALLFTFKRCMAENSKRHIIIVLSDGEPAGAKTWRDDEQMLRDSIKFCRENGAEVYGFGMLTSSPKQYYGEENFVYLKDDESFNTDFFGDVARIIAKQL